MLIAQLQRRSRVMFASILGGLTTVAIGLAVFMFNALTNITPPSPEIREETTTAQPTPINRDSDSGTTAIITPADGSLSRPTRPDVSRQDKQNFLSAVQNFDNNIRAKVANFTRLARLSAYLSLITQLEADLVSLSSEGRFKDASHTLTNAQ